MLVGLVAGVAIGTAVMKGTAGGEADLQLYARVRNLVERDFVREVDRRAMLDDALAGLVDGLDPYSAYYSSRELAGLDRDTQGLYTGLGLIFKRPVDEGRVLHPLPGSPAERAGLRVGDRILEVDGSAVAAMAPGEFQQSLERGPEHELDLLVEARSGERRRVRITPEEIVDPSVRHARMVDEELGIGHVSISSFTHQTPAELDAAVASLRASGMRALVLDLRSNPGGMLPAAIEVANRFLREGVIVTTRSRRGSHDSLARAEAASLADLPLVVLVDGDSASASEIVAGALQDHRAAVIAGAPTYGKGAFQTLMEFESERAVVKLTTGYYTTPAGRLIERSLQEPENSGIEPDLLVEVGSVERGRIHGWLHGYGTPPAYRDELAAWSAEEGVELVPEPPADAQLVAALELLRGRRPDPQSESDEPGSTPR